MALSNWDTLAINNEGKSCNGTLRHGDMYVETYKNWLSVMTGTGKDRKQLVHITHGELNVPGIEINAIRGPQNSVIAYVQAGYGENANRMFTIGGYGYSDETNKILRAVGLNPKKLVDMKDYMISTLYSYDPDDKEKPSMIHVHLLKEKRVLELEETEEYKAKWIGITPKTLRYGLSWLRKQFSEYDKEELAWYEKIKPQELVRFNQGDAFFEDNLGTPLNATKVGEAESPVMIQMLKGTS